MENLHEAYSNYYTDLMDKKDWLLKRMRHSQLLIQDFYSETKTPHKYFLIFKDEKEMISKLSGKIYAIYDTDNNFLGDLFEEDFVHLVDRGIIVDLTENGKHRELIRRNLASDYICIKKENVDSIKQHRMIIYFLDKIYNYD